MISKTLQIAAKEKFSLVDGRGIRYTIFLSGCTHKCDGCHSTHTWDFNYGKKEDIVELFYNIYSKRHYIDGVSISGGDPIEQSENLLPLVKMLKSVGFNIWLWTGYTFSYLNDNHPELISNLDVIIDGKYDKNKPTDNPYKGSSNQVMWENKNKKYIEVKNYE